MKSILKNIHGYSLFELIVVMVILSVLITVAMKSMQPSLEIARTEESKEEMEQLAKAIAGNPDLIQGGNRTDFGYVGDIGALPNALNNLVTNPGLATWDGPYVKDDFYSSTSSSEFEYLIDGWGNSYTYAGVTIASSGNGSPMTKEISSHPSNLLYNNVSFNVSDLNYCVPGVTYQDSIIFNLTYPDGSGSYQTDSKNPSTNGLVVFDSIPIGQHRLQIIESVSSDTLIRYITVNPNSTSHLDIQLTQTLWCDTTSVVSGGTISDVEILRPMGVGSASQLDDENCSINWQCVDETTADGNSTYVKGGDNQWEYDLYSTENHSTGSGVIDSLIIYIVASENSSNQRVATYLRTNSNNYTGTTVNPTGSYLTYSTLYETNPNTSAAWSWGEIDALEIGVAIRREARVTQVWIEVYYTY